MTGNKIIDELLAKGSQISPGRMCVEIHGKTKVMNLFHNYCVIGGIDDHYVEIMYDDDDEKTQNCIDSLAWESFTTDRHNFVISIRGNIKISSNYNFTYGAANNRFKSKWVKLMDPQEFMRKTVSVLKLISTHYGRIHRYV